VALAPNTYAAPGAPVAPGVTGKTSGNVLLLVPLSGQYAAAGEALANAAKLAFANVTSPALDIRDTQGTADGAAAAAQAGIAAGDGLILGPLTSAETKAVSPIAQSADVNMLAFTNDGTVAAPGVWPLGITPAQQVQRVLQAAADSGRTQLAALLPDDDFGHHLSDAITAETQALNEPAPQITFYGSDSDAAQQAALSLSDYQDRGAGIDAQIKQAKEEGTPAGYERARELMHQQVPPPSFNALFIGTTDANTLALLASFLPFYYVDPPQVQFLGPALWSSLASQMASQPVFLGAMFAAPDPAAAQAFDAKYQAAYGEAPPVIAGLGFDAAAIARLAAASGGYTSSVLTAPAGFTGTDGVLVLEANGSVKRGLAVFSVAPGQPSLTSPAPATLPSGT
jgi:ABC-type branched-subunit amino acid transport system substrate-binding protein